MNHHLSTSRAIEIDTRLVTVGAVLTAGGALLAFTGMALAGFALATAGRRWVRQLDVPPSQRAAARLQQARQASQAGLEAWRSGGDGRTA
ncbi:hypothetical protein [Peterkaempfera bronchialis]|uniref:Uncharacterized protein n=1 Tax=Peterkaempfera bronchialis TaxID=2126346 RepID=A0A345SS78_9ACTN|nr:hypothetical protein [Peterkaempfera bronchialis]AXI76583.1 hypothetical protein C7M71_002945 [Peterkaempfera bronchialis]